MSQPTLRYEVQTTVHGEASAPRAVAVRLLGVGVDGARRYALQLDGGPERVVEVVQTEPTLRNLLVDGRSIEAGAVAREDGFLVDIRGIPHEVSVIDPKKKALRAGASEGAGQVRTQMPGRVVRVLVAPGATVEKGEPLVVVEAMKMENEIKAPRAGVVAKIAVKDGDLVEGRAVLVELS